MVDNVSTAIRDLLERKPNKSDSAEVVDAEAVEPEEYAALANGRIGNRAQLSLVFRKASGAAHAYSYTHLFSVESDNPNEGFTVTYSAAKTVVVRGQNLAILFETVCRHRAAEIVEATRAQALETAKFYPIVTSIELPARTSPLKG
ncbi:hypothetical protein [Anatilimnocola floriformis]|uniref:hypothetical protein n=1 Tax=Anatilimnocola floriformis TaxID=2948575 RepID=UPI0020C41490|nr:hypothetical protein [Anatilimnocola floriformis]